MAILQIENWRKTNVIQYLTFENLVAGLSWKYDEAGYHNWDTHVGRFNVYNVKMYSQTEKHHPDKTNSPTSNEQTMLGSPHFL